MQNIAEFYDEHPSGTSPSYFSVEIDEAVPDKIYLSGSDPDLDLVWPGMYLTADSAKKLTYFINDLIPLLETS